MKKNQIIIKEYKFIDSIKNKIEEHKKKVDELLLLYKIKKKGGYDYYNQKKNKGMFYLPRYTNYKKNKIFYIIVIIFSEKIFKFRSTIKKFNYFWLFNQITKFLISLNIRDLNIANNKKKPFINLISIKKNKIKDLKTKISEIENNIDSFRKNKILFYKNHKTSNYDTIIDKVENEIRFNRNRFYFFDNEYIYKKFNDIEKLKTNINQLLLEIDFIKSNERIFLSEKYKSFLIDIGSSYLKEPINSNKQIIKNTKNKDNYNKKYEFEQKIMKLKKKRITNKNRLPLIINNMSLFEDFYNKINNIIKSKLNQQIKMSKTIITNEKNEIIKLDSELKFNLDIYNNRIKNYKLENKYFYYCRQLDILEKEILILYKESVLKSKT